MVIKPSGTDTITINMASASSGWVFSFTALGTWALLEDILNCDY